jgi:receptor protein-tyrosine kinase
MNAPGRPTSRTRSILTVRKKTIGDILVDSGRLKPDALARVLERQKRDRLPFGEAAIAVKAATRDDIDFALSKQFNYSYLAETDKSISQHVIAAYKPFSRVGENLRAIRSQLMLRWFNGEPTHKAIAVVSPTAGDGRSFIAANLAVVFAQQGERTLLIDADLRSSPENGQQALFKLNRNAGLSDMLAGRSGTDAMQLVPGLPTLGILAAGAIPPNPQELLGRSMFGKVLRGAAARFDVIIIDTPNGTDYADAEIVAARAGAAIMLARINRSKVPQATAFAGRLRDGGVTMVGAVLNDV